MTNRTITAATDAEVDVRALLWSLLRSSPYLIVFMIIIVLGTFVLLSHLAPRYKSETTILIQSGESDLTRSASDPAATGTILDEQAITSQVQLIRSRDLGRTVAAKLKLDALPEFDPALGKGSLITDLLSRFGLAKDPLTSSVEERVLQSYYEKLLVYEVEKSRVIAIDFTSTDPQLAADAANAIAEEYLALQRGAKRDTTADATKWLESEIADLRVKVKEAEAKVETFRSSNNLFTSGGQAPTTLPEQQLADLNAELTKVRATRADAETKAEQIRAALKNGVTPNLTDVLNSQLIQRLVEQEVALRSQIAQLSATLLPEHPRMKELQAQIADLDAQIAREAKKVLDAAESDANLAQARVDEIERNLGQLKTAATQANDAGVQLRALDREASAERDLLDTYLHRYRDAIGRQNADYLPADARIISRASVPIQPDFPKKVPMTAAATAAALLLAIAFILVRELASGRPMRTVTFGEPLPKVPAAVPVGGRMRWADDHSVRRMMANEPTLVPNFVDRVEESLAAIAGEIIAAKKKRIIVTLGEGSDAAGRPLAAVALARALARTDARAVLVDLRGDGADSISMGEETDLPGFADLFAGETSFAQVIFRDRKSRVHFIPGGRKLPIPEELSGERLETILDALDHTYDYVVFDASNEMIEPFGRSADVAVVVSEFGAADPRTIRAFDRITASSSANILLLVVDPAPAANIDMAAREEAGAAA
jgi:succinoglycan biosynthesis transport protein ExoP